MRGRLGRGLANFSTGAAARPNLIEIFINDESHMVDPKMTIFQACFHAGVVIPRFCFHEKLSIAGNCRMCLVDVEKAPKPVASCAAQVAPGMRIHTNSEKARVYRGAVMEFILANHPLDCPVCDQGGECDLQDISVKFGFSDGRFKEYKRAVEDKNIGPLISTHMNRCIHCTRCVRFTEEVAGISELGTLGRGRATEIGTYISKLIGSELSGNAVDLCPVGALNHGPITYRNRPWDLQATDAVDLLDAIIPSVEFSYRGPEILRVLPKVNEAVNEEWISDKSRWAFDGLRRQRLTFPMRKNRDGELEEVEWDTGLKVLASKLQEIDPRTELAGLVGQFTSLESAAALRDFFANLGAKHLAWAAHPFANGTRAHFLLNRSIPELEELDALVLVGCNPKLESPVLNARLLKASRKGMRVFKFGAPDDLGYPFIHLGNSEKSLDEFLAGTHPASKALRESKNVHFLFSSELAREFPRARETLLRAKVAATDLAALSGGQVTAGILHNFVGPISGYEVGINYSSLEELPSKIKVLINFGNDEKNFLAQVGAKLAPDALVVYVGTNGDAGASQANLILPSAGFTECPATYVSTEGRVQLGQKVVPPPYLAKPEWMILRALSEEVGSPLPYNSLEELRYRLAELCPYAFKYDHLEPFSPFSYAFEAQKAKPAQKNEKDLSFIFRSSVDNFYKTDAISRSSLVMNICSAAFNTEQLSNFPKKLYK